MYLSGIITSITRIYFNMRLSKDRRVKSITTGLEGQLVCVQTDGRPCSNTAPSITLLFHTNGRYTNTVLK